jgi:hypothetical protein
VGTAQNPIIIRAYPGERVIVDGGIETSTTARYNWFWGFEVIDSRPFDVPSTSRLVSGGELRPGFNFNSGGVGAHPGHKVIHCTLRNTGHPGIGFWNQGAGGEIYGSYIYGSGVLDDTQQPAWVRGSGLYGQNDSTSSTVELTKNIWFKNFCTGINMYGEGGQVRGVTAAYNISFVNEDEDLWFAVTSAGNLEAVTVDHNYTWKEPSETEAGACSTQIGYGGDQISATVTNNYLVGGECGTDTTFYTRSIDTLTVTGNTIVAPRYIAGNYYPSDNSHSSITWNNNAYYGGWLAQGPTFYPFWTYKNGAEDWQDFAEWKADNSYDSNSTHSSSLPSTNRVFVIPVDKYEPGRTHVAIYNWQNLDSVNVDLSPSGITSGQSYQVYDAECLTACGPVASGTYNGSPISFPMTMTAQDQVTGEQNYNEARIFNHTSKRFNAFVVRYQ